MAQAFLEHVNITVSDPAKTAQMLCDLFDWKVRWQSDAIHDGSCIHVGEENSYIALYAPTGPALAAINSYQTRGGLNHIAVVVEDIEEVDKRVRSLGYEPHSYADYEPGRRFYFREENEIEFEVVSY